MLINYSKQQKETTKKVRDLLTELLACASSANMDEEQLAMLKETLQALEDSFLVVVVGEFNGGKSSFINALLNTDKLAVGVTPTTAQINLIRFGEQESSSPIENWGLLLQLPVPLLESMTFVDTPGTNAVLREHEVLTKWFLPRADMVMFLTSADRPFSESERQFLAAIKEWGKNAVILVNKMDLLESDEEKAKVVSFVKENAAALIGQEVPVLPISSRTAKKARDAMSEDLWKESGFAELEQFIQNRMDERARFQMKMQSALGIAAKVEAEAETRVRNELAFYEEDRKLAESISGQVSLYREDMMKEINRSMKEIHSIFTEIKSRGHDYFEELFVLKNLPNLLKKDKNQVKFQEDVLKNLPIEVERKTTEMVESIGTQEQRMVQSIRLQIQSRNSEFPSVEMPEKVMDERAKLLKRMQNSIDAMLAKIESDIAMDIGMKHAQSAVTAGLAIEVSAIGIGAALTAIATTVATDLLGIVAAFWVGIAGFLVLPYYKKKAQKEFDEKISEIDTKLVDSLRGEFVNEVNAQAEEMNNAARPFGRFVETSIGKSQAQLEKLTEIRGQIKEYQSKLE